MEGMFRKVDFVSYLVSDWQRAKKFYGETLGLPVAALISDEVGWMEFGEKDATHLAISLWQGPGPLPPAGRGGIVIFAVPDTYAAVAELRKRGIKCEDVVAIPEMVTYADFYDPDGNLLEIAGPPPAKG